MDSRHGRIASQLTQWVGGTIIMLMFIFVLADFAIQSNFFENHQDMVALTGAEGIKAILERNAPVDDSLAQLQAAASLTDYGAASDRNFAVFDSDGEVLVKTFDALSNIPEENAHLSRPPSGEIDFRRLTKGGATVVAAVASFVSRSETPVRGTIVYIVSIDQQRQMALNMWGIRSLIVLGMIIGTMLAVRIPVNKFVVAPIDGLFMAAYAASKDDFQKLPPCPVDNEFAELYDMFGRLMGHLSDTRVSEITAGKTDELDGFVEGPLE